MESWGGYLNDWLVGIVGRRWARCCVGFTGKSVACILMFVAIAQQSGVAAAWALFFVKFFSDWSQPTVWGTCTDLGGRKYSATVFGIINTSGSFGGFCTPIFFGIVLDHYTTKQVVDGIEKLVTDYNPIFYVVAMMYIISACCWFLIDSTQSLENELKPNPDAELTSC